MTPFSSLASTFSALEATSSRIAMVATLAKPLRTLETRETQPSIYLLQGRLGLPAHTLSPPRPLRDGGRDIYQAH